MRNRLLVVLGIVATLFVTLGTVLDMELARARGDLVLLELAPRDPRSIIQGDYMRLNYDVGRQATLERGDEPIRGTLVVNLDADRVGTFSRFDDGAALGADEHRLHYRIRDKRVEVGVSSWMFEEGSAEVWDQARYGEFRVLPGGRAVLVGLRDADRQGIRAPLKPW